VRATGLTFATGNGFLTGRDWARRPIGGSHAARQPGEDALDGLTGKASTQERHRDVES
jgi:hypothetical protein